MIRLIFMLMALTASTLSFGQEEIPLYSGAVPNAVSAPSYKELSEKGADGRVRISRISVPTLTVFRAAADLATGTAVIICPGGGYRYASISHEGYTVAAELAKWGITAFVLKYRMPNDSVMVDKTIGPLQDAQSAIQLVRSRAREWNIRPDRVGIMGFSAGGHLASTAGTHFEMPVIERQKRISLRPDFMVLIYPVISFNDSIAHKGSRDNLLGLKPSAEKVALYSNELQVKKNTPPTFLVHAKDDKTVPVANAIIFNEKLQQLNVKSQFMLYDTGGHGFGMLKNNWMPELRNWLEGQGFLQK